MESAQITSIFAGSVRSRLTREPLDYDGLYEIRLRAERPVLVVYQGKEWFLGEKGGLEREERRSYTARKEDIRETLEYIAGYSLYAFEEELRQGFLTIQGGHRVGVAGKTVMEGGKVQSMTDISFLNLRLAHEKRGCADPVMPWVRQKEDIYDTLIISPPRCGKTTLLRDMIRQISNGDEKCAGCTVGVVDERSELAGCWQGVPQNDLGIRTDVLDACKKAEGMLMLLRSMAPRVVAVDELGPLEDLQGIESVIHCGCRLLATMHGNSLDDVRRRPLMERLWRERIFSRYLVLKGGGRAGVLEGIYDGEGRKIGEG